MRVISERLSRFYGVYEPSAKREKYYIKIILSREKKNCFASQYKSKGYENRLRRTTNPCVPVQFWGGTIVTYDKKTLRLKRPKRFFVADRPWGPYSVQSLNMQPLFLGDRERSSSQKETAQRGRLVFPQTRKTRHLAELLIPFSAATCYAGCFLADRPDIRRAREP